MTAASVASALEEAGDVALIRVHLNSPGGDVFEGMTMLNLLKAHSARVEVLVDGIAASAASFVAMAGDRIVMGEGSMLMIHNPMTIMWGNAAELRKQAEVLDKVAGEMAGIYAKRTGKSEDQARAWMDAETWFTGKEAVEAGLADELVAEENHRGTEAQRNQTGETASDCLPEAPLLAFGSRSTTQPSRTERPFAPAAEEAGAKSRGSSLSSTPLEVGSGRDAEPQSRETAGEQEPQRTQGTRKRKVRAGVTGPHLVFCGGGWVGGPTAGALAVGGCPHCEGPPLR